MIYRPSPHVSVLVFYVIVLVDVDDDDDDDDVASEKSINILFR